MELLELVEKKKKNETEIISLLRDKNKNYYIKKEAFDKHQINTLINEFNILNLLRNCCYTPKIREYAFSDSYANIIMDYMPGVNLIQKKFNTTREKTLFMLKLIDCISILHRKNIIHADLKPNHIIIDENECIRIIDFGISVYDDKNYFRGYANPYYCSVEQMTGDKLSFKSDIYTLGVIFYELLNGEKPFNGTEDDIRTMKLNNDYKKSDNTFFQKIFNKTMNFNPSYRYQTLKEFSEDIVSLLYNI